MKNVVKSVNGNKKKLPLTALEINRLETEEIIQHARRFGLAKISHPDNIARGIIPGQKLKKEEVLKELGLTNLELRSVDKQITKTNPKLVGEFRLQYKKDLRESLKDNSEDFLSKVFKQGSSLEIDDDKKARLALDILKATDKEYNQNTASAVTINLTELPLGEGLLEAQKKIILELGITSDIFNNIDN